MLTNLIESLIILLFNRVRDRRRESHDHPALSGSDPNVLVGYNLDANPLSGRLEPVFLADSSRRKHLYAIGSTGCGKTNLLLKLIESDIGIGRSLCVIDLRGDLVDRILLRLATTRNPDSLADRLLLLDLRDPEHVVGFNPLAGDGDAYSRAFHVLAVLRKQAESWGVQLEETLRNALLVLAEAGWSLLELEPLLTDPTFRAQALSMVTDGQVLSFFRRYERLSPERQQAFVLPTLNKVTPLLGIPALRNLLSARQSAFSFRRLLDETPGAVILVALAVDRLHEAAHLVGGLLVSALQNSVMARVDQPEAARVPVHLYIDEFETMASDRFESIIAEGRRFAIGLCLSHQNVSQLPARLKHVIRNNVHAQFLFQTGALDAAELAAEVNLPDNSDTIKTALIAQDVGECHLVRRGLPTVRLLVSYTSDPQVPADAVAALRQQALSRYGRPRIEVERELAQRSAGANGSSTTQNSQPSTGTGAFEVRPASSKRRRRGSYDGPQ
jgi:hypothetical protein